MAVGARLTRLLAVAAAAVQEVVDHDELLAECLARRLALAQVLPALLAPVQYVHGLVDADHDGLVAYERARRPARVLAIGQSEVLVALDEELSAPRLAFDQLVARHDVHELVRLHRVEANVLHELIGRRGGDIRVATNYYLLVDTAARRIVVAQPLDAHHEDADLGKELELVAAHEVAHLLEREALVLIVGDELVEVAQYVAVDLALQVVDAEHVGQIEEVDAVLHPALVDEKVLAQLQRVLDLQERDGAQHVGYVGQRERQLAGVDEVDGLLDALHRDVLEVDVARASLLHAAVEHGGEEVARRDHQALVHAKLHTLHVYAHVAQTRRAQALLVESLEQVVLVAERFLVARRRLVSMHSQYVSCTLNMYRLS